MFNPRFQVSRVNSMQWNRTVNAEIFAAVVDNKEQTKKAIPKEVLAKVQALLQKELAAHATAELTKTEKPKEGVVTAKVTTR